MALEALRQFTEVGSLSAAPAAAEAYPVVGLVVPGAVRKFTGTDLQWVVRVARRDKPIVADEEVEAPWKSSEFRINNFLMGVGFGSLAAVDRGPRLQINHPHRTKSPNEDPRRSAFHRPDDDGAT